MNVPSQRDTKFKNRIDAWTESCEYWSNLWIKKRILWSPLAMASTSGDYRAEISGVAAQWKQTEPEWDGQWQKVHYIGRIYDISGDWCKSTISIREVSRNEWHKNECQLITTWSDRAECLRAGACGASRRRQDARVVCLCGSQTQTDKGERWPFPRWAAENIEFVKILYMVIIHLMMMDGDSNHTCFCWSLQGGPELLKKRIGILLVVSRSNLHN